MTTLDRLAERRAAVTCWDGVLGTRQVLVEVVARDGVLIVHRDVLKQGWIITHQPSGRRLWRFRRRADAVRALAEIAALPVDWPNVKPGAMPFTPEQRDAFAAVVGKYNA